LTAETSCLVAREAIACGTPVIGFRNGALPETIDEGESGFLVANVAEMAQAIGRAADLSPAQCRRIAAERFSLSRMAQRYLDTYALFAPKGSSMPLKGAA